VALYGTRTADAIEYAKASCARRERDVVVWRMGDLVGVTSKLAEGAVLIGTARFVGRGVLWEPAP
jgi:hypothetical protein